MNIDVGGRLDARGPRAGSRSRRGLLLAIVALGACAGDPPTQDGPSSHLRFVQAVPNAPAVDLLVDSAPRAASLGYGAATGFLRVEAGNRRVQMRQSGTSTMLMDLTMPVEFPRAYTVISSGLLNEVQPIVAPDTASIPLAGEIKLRVLQMAPSGGTVDVYVTGPNAALAGATPVFQDLPFRGNTEYLVLPVGNVRIRITTAGTTTTLVDLTRLFGERVMRTVVMTDAAGGGAPFTGLLLVDF